MNTHNEAASDVSKGIQASPSTAAPCEARARYEAAAQALSEALGRKKVMSERVAKMARAGEAAQAQANAAREEYRGLLRQADGELTREVQKLRASERSSLALVEEYAALQQEIQAQVKGMELEVAELASVGMKMRKKVLELASREAFDVLIAQAGDAMAEAYVLHRRATLSLLPPQMRPSDEQVFASFLHQLGRHINARQQMAGESVTELSGVRELELDGVDVALASSSARRWILRHQIVDSVTTA